MGLSAQARRAIAVLGGKEITTRNGTRVVLDRARHNDTRPYCLYGRAWLEPTVPSVISWTDVGWFLESGNEHHLDIDIKGWIEKMTAPKSEYTAEEIIDTLKDKELIGLDGVTKIKLRTFSPGSSVEYPLIGSYFTGGNWLPDYWRIDGRFQTGPIHSYNIDIARYMQEAKYGEVKPGLELHDASTVTVPRRPEAVAALEAAINLFAANITQHFKNSDSLDDLKVLLDHRAELQALLARLKA